MGKEIAFPLISSVQDYLDESGIQKHGGNRNQLISKNRNADKQHLPFGESTVKV